MIGLNTLLKNAGIDPAKTRLVRHQDTSSAARHRTPYDLWAANDGRFELYQRIQGKERFRDALSIASFVATPWNETLFVGAYTVKGVGRAPAGTIDPIAARDMAGHYFYDLESVKSLQDYAGRVIIEWGPAARIWIQWAHKRDRPIIEIRREAFERPFPGFSSFSWRIKDLASVPRSWRETLSSVSGVYVLVCQSTGRKYVGSADSEGGFWSRWEAYARNGHGGNAGLKLDPEKDYRVSILEVASSFTTRNEIQALEARWKDKLETRKFGFNRN